MSAVYKEIQSTDSAKTLSQIKLLVSKRRGMYDVLVLLGWEGVVFCPFIPTRWRSSNPKEWESVCKSIATFKGRLPDLVKTKCPNWNTLVGDQLRSRVNILADDGGDPLLVKLRNIRPLPGGDGIESIVTLTNDEIAAVEDMERPYNQRIIDFIGNTIGLLDPRTKRFITNDMFKMILRHVDFGLTPPAVFYTFTFKDSFHSTLRTIAFSIFVDENGSNTNSGQRRAAPNGAVGIVFSLQTGVVMILPMSQREDVWNAERCKRTEALMSRLNFLQKLFDTENIELDFQVFRFEVAPQHSAPLFLRYVAALFENEDATSPIDKATTDDSIFELRRTLRKLVANSLRPNTLRLVPYDPSKRRPA
jgi:hypothetical protein